MWFIDWAKLADKTDFLIKYLLTIYPQLGILKELNLKKVVLFRQIKKLEKLNHLIEWEGRSGWGIHVNPWLIHVNVWQKPLQYCKVISLQLIQIKKK